MTWLGGVDTLHAKVRPFMLPVIENLLILQDRDRRIQRLQTELGGIAPERALLQSKTQGTQAALEAARQRALHIESDRKKLELEVVGKKELIDKYSIQQFQTRKNEEYRALAHEIETCKAAIVGLEDQQLELMEQAEAAAKAVAVANAAFQEMKKLADTQLADLAGREINLGKELEALLQSRDQLASSVDQDVLPRYQRLRRTKGETVVVGIDHAVCGGCRLRLPPQSLVSCQGEQEITTCPNCGRMLYFTPEMDLTPTD